MSQLLADAIRDVFSPGNRRGPYDENGPVEKLTIVDMLYSQNESIDNNAQATIEAGQNIRDGLESLATSIDYLVKAVWGINKE